MLQAGLQQQIPANVSVLLKPEGHLTENSESLIGPGASDKQLNEGLRNCIKEFAPLGPGTGRFENQRTLFLPVRGRTKAFGAVSIQGRQMADLSQAKRAYLQQMCDLLGLEIERDLTLKQAQQSKEEAQNQSIRNTLLTSISHDYRTPLANLIGAASVIHSQNTKLNTGQVTELAQTVLLEAQHLNRMTSNTLQLARLDAAPWKVHKDWESLQEIIGSVLSKTRLRYPQRDIQVFMPDALPLVFCDAMLLVQLFDNLVENAIKYSPPTTRIDIQVITQSSELQVRVTDRGTGIPDAWKDKVFQAFERMHDESAQADASDESQLRRGVGVGLAVCKAIAKVHDARNWVEDTQPQGATVCLAFAIEHQPDMNASLPEV